MIFLSYSRADKDFALRIVECLNRIGHDVWWDHALLAGTNYQIEINKRLQAAKSVVVLWSDSSVISEWVLAEAEVARSRGILRPLKIADVQVPAPFNLIHSVSVANGLDAESIETHCRSLMGANSEFRAQQGQSRPSRIKPDFSGKRILSIDGGRARIALQLGLLEHVERTLRESGRIGPDSVLADYFDMIGGVSSGALLAALLAQGRSVSDTTSEIRMFNRDRAVRRVSPLSQVLSSTGANNRRLKKSLSKRFGDVTLEGAGFKSLLTVPVWRADKLCFEFFSSNKHDPTWSAQSATKMGRYPKSNASISKVLTAAMAQPLIFQPEIFPLGPEEKDTLLFEGAANNPNPSLALYNYATRENYGLSWPSNEQSLYMLSIGHGMTESHARNLLREPSMFQAIRVLVNNIEHNARETVQQCQQKFVTRKPYYIGPFNYASERNDQRGLFQRLDSPLESEFVRMAYGMDIRRDLWRKFFDPFEYSDTKLDVLLEIGRRAGAQSFGFEDAV